MPRRAARQRNAAVHPLHQRLDRQTEGHQHTTAGYNLFVKKTFEWVFDHRDEDIFWCTADCGWVTGHSYIVYGPLSAGATTLMYEGAPNWPDEDRFWEIIEKYRVNILYTAPTAIRAFIKWGDQHVDKHDLSSLRLLGTVGEGINPEAWMWYHRKIGGERCPIVDTWWQTETGGIMMSPAAGRHRHQARQLHQAAAGRRARRSSTSRASRSTQGHGGCSCISQALAGHAPRHLGRRRALRAAVLEQGAAATTSPATTPAGRRRLLLDHGPHRRRDQRLAATG